MQSPSTHPEMVNARGRGYDVVATYESDSNVMVRRRRGGGGGGGGGSSSSC